MKFVDNEEAEHIPYMACVRKADDPAKFVDNLEDVCAKCGHTIVYRPTAPKEPVRICLDCAIAMMGDVENLVNESATTSESFAEAVKFILKRRTN